MTDEEWKALQDRVAKLEQYAGPEFQRAVMREEFRQDQIMGQAAQKQEPHVGPPQGVTSYKRPKAGLMGWLMPV